MQKIAIALFGICLLFFSTAGRATPLDDIIKSTFRPAIVKIDVSSNTVVIKDNVNVCKSEGTGFLVSANHVVTDEHVYALAPECGERIIIVKSAPYRLQKLATVVAAKNDVALLKVDSDFPPEICALGLMAQDVYATDAIRFGIPALFDEPGPPDPVTIGPPAAQFAPLVLLKPSFAEQGESGGPVIVLLNVVGITRARHAQYPAYSFMTVGSTIRTLMAANSVRPSDNICNPVKSGMWTTFDPAPSSGGIFGKFGNNFNFNFDGTSKPPLTGKVVASVNLDHHFAAQMSSIEPDVFKGFVKTFDDQNLTVSPDSSGTNVSVQGRFKSAQEQREVAAKAARTTDDISQQLRETFWNQYIAEGKKAGKWSGAVISPGAPTIPKPDRP